MSPPLQWIVERLVLVSRMVWAGAVPLMAWLAGAFFLVVPTQTTDLLAQSSSWQSLLFFPVSVALWAFTCWFWTTWGINLQPMNWPETPAATAIVKHALVRPNDVTGVGRRLRLWLPRIPLLGSLPVAFISCWRTEAVFSVGWWESVLPIGLVLLAMEAALWLAVVRRSRAAPPAARRTTRLGRVMDLLDDLRPIGDVSHSQGTFGVRTCLARLPLGPMSFVYWLALFFAVAGVLYAWPVAVPHALGAPSATFFCLAALTGLVAFPSVLIRRVTGFPGSLVICAWVALITQINGSHHIRTIESDGPDIGLQSPGGSSPTPGTTYRLPGHRPTLAKALAAWQAACNPGDPMPDIILVATAGGASRAALWTASALRSIEQSVTERRLRARLFAISGVSGGSLGAAAYLAALPPGGCTAPEELTDQSSRRWANERAALGTEFLSPPLAGYLSTDVLASFVPLRVSDRAAALESAWERAWRNAWTHPAAQPELVPTGEFQRSFLSLWMRGGQIPPEHDAPDPDWIATTPLLFFNGTHAASGLPILTAPVRINRNMFPLALDLLDIVGRDIRLSTAVTNSARFPVVSPGGVLTARDGTYQGYVMDGGYVENYGADTVRDLLRGIDALKTKRGADCVAGTKCGPRVAVIQISSDPSLPADLLPRCGQPPDAPLPPDRVATPVQVLADLFGPLFTVVEARGARGARTAGDLMRAKCPLTNLPGTAAPLDEATEYFHFGLCDEDIPGNGRQSEVIGLNWALTKAAADFLAPLQVSTWNGQRSTPHQSNGRASAMEACGNLNELRHLVDWFDHPIMDRPKATESASLVSPPPQAPPAPP